MQKVMIISDEKSIADLNTILAEEEFMITKISGGANSHWLVVLDDESFETLDDIFEYEEDENN